MAHAEREFYDALARRPQSQYEATDRQLGKYGGDEGIRRIGLRYVSRDSNIFARYVKTVNIKMSLV